MLVRVAHRDFERSEPHPEQWLLIEWPDDQDEPSKYWLANLDEKPTRQQRVESAKQRWLIERDDSQISGSRTVTPAAARSFLWLSLFITS